MLVPGALAPDFTGYDFINGEEFTLSDHRGKTIYLDFSSYL